MDALSIDNPCSVEGKDAMSKVYKAAMSIRKLMADGDGCNPCDDNGNSGGEAGTGEGIVDVVVDGASVVDPETKVANVNLSGKADASSFNAHVQDKSNPHAVTKAQVGLGNVENTSDADKPVSIAQQTALNTKANQTDLTAEATTRNAADTALQTAVNNSKATGLAYDASTHIVTLTLGDGTTRTFILPQSSETEDGLFSSSDYTALRNLLADVESLKSGGVWRGNFDTYEDLDAAYPNLDVSATNWFKNDFIYVIADSQHGDNSTAYAVNVDGDVKTLIFQRTTDSPTTGVPQATNTQLGIIKGSTVKGRGYVETTGEISLNGYDELVEGIENAQSDIDVHKSDNDNPHAVTKAQVGLSEVNNTSDLNKPVSNPTQTALNGKFNLAGRNPIVPGNSYFERVNVLDNESGTYVGLLPTSSTMSYLPKYKSATFDSSFGSFYFTIDGSGYLTMEGTIYSGDVRATITVKGVEIRSNSLTPISVNNAVFDSENSYLSIFMLVVQAGFALLEIHIDGAVLHIFVMPGGDCLYKIDIIQAA